MTSESSRPKRLQGSYISDAEIQRMVYFWGNQGGMDSSLINFDEIEEPITLSQKLASGPDPLLEEVRNLAKQHEHISASFLQRRLHIGYPRAARLIDILEKESQDSGSAQERANKPQTPSSSEEPRH
jgi:S-DNA-T family DNA segregation ATPase FtsK/SpoIIIE